MKGFKLKIFLGLIITMLFFASPIFGQERQLELDYPEIEGFSPQTVSTGLPDYVKYLFNFSLGIAALVCFIVLVYAGFRWATSMGNPAKKLDAKDRVFSAFLGLTILVFSYLIFTTINPELVIFEMAEIEKVQEAPPSPSPTEKMSIDPLTRIVKLARDVKGSAYDLSKAGSVLYGAVEACSCDYVRSFCDCGGLSCIPRFCYGYPCLDRDSMVEHQKKLVEMIDQILYYKNRVNIERQHMGPELERFQFWGTLNESQSRDLVDKMESLPEKIIEMSRAGQNLVWLPETCSARNCDAGCTQESCHDTPGCRSLVCTGENPCNLHKPCMSAEAGEDETDVEFMKRMYQEISDICDAIINILE